MAVLTLSGRAALAASLKAQPIHLAWGRGLPEWDIEPVPEPVDATGLTDEIGRRTAAFVRYCAPSETGEIQVPNGRFTEVEDVTNHLYCRFNFDFEDSPNETIRETGIFVGSKVVEGLPAGQEYFTPDQLQSAGILLVVERFDAFKRSSAVRQAFEFVVTI